MVPVSWGPVRAWRGAVRVRVGSCGRAEIVVVRRRRMGIRFLGDGMLINSSMMDYATIRMFFLRQQAYILSLFKSRKHTSVRGL
jgi:hypothetical protein